jgi:hypothetical protein
MLLWIVLLLCLFAILFPNTGFPKTLASRYERLVHPYSGLDPDEWRSLKVNIRAFEGQQDVGLAARQLDAALGNIRNLALAIQRSDDGDIQQRLEDIAEQLAIEGERIIFDMATKQRVYFFPKYLNETIDSQTENNADTRRGGTIGDPGVHYPAPRQRGDTGPLPSEDAFWSGRQGPGTLLAAGEV